MILRWIFTIGALCAATCANAETVLITGSDRGIGLEFAREYADKGWTVIATAYAPEQSAALQELARAHRNITVERLDVSDLPAIKVLAARYRGRPIDVLINNAGVLLNTDDQEIGSFNRDTFHRIMDVNAFGAIAVSEAFLENVKRGGHKKVIAITSGAGSLSEAPGDYGMLFYKMSKVALNMAMQELKAEPNSKGLIFGMIAPGFVETQLARELRESGLGRGRNIPRGLAPAESVAGMMQVIAHLDPESSKRVHNYDGSVIPF